jgi:hypothetical protein
VERRRRPGRRRRRDNRARVVFAPGAGGAWRRWRCSAPPRATRRLPGGHRGCAREAAAAGKPRPRSRGRRRRSPRTCDQVPCGENLADAAEVVKRETTRTIGPRKRRAVRAQVNVALVLAAVLYATSVGNRSRCAATDRGAAASSTAERRRTPSSLDRPGSRAGGPAPAIGVATPFVSRRAQRELRGRVPRAAKRPWRGRRGATCRELRRALPDNAEARDLESVQRAGREVLVRPGRVCMRCHTRGGPARCSVTPQLVELLAVLSGEALRERFVEEIWHRMTSGTSSRQARGREPALGATEKRKPSWFQPGWLRRTYRDRRSFGVGSRPNSGLIDGSAERSPTSRAG